MLNSVVITCWWAGSFKEQVFPVEVCSGATTNSSGSIIPSNYSYLRIQAKMGSLSQHIFLIGKSNASIKFHNIYKTLQA